MSARSWVALLRAVNLGPRRKVAMADLRALLEQLGFEDVRTHLQSGNALFTTGRGSERALERRIAEGLHAQLGLDATVFVRTAAELAAIVDANPFRARGVDPKELYVTFLSSEPRARRAADIDPAGYAPDEFAIGKRVVYLRLRDGVMGSRLPDWERLLGLRATTRSWNTVTRLREMADS